MTSRRRGRGRLPLAALALAVVTVLAVPPPAALGSTGTDEPGTAGPGATTTGTAGVDADTAGAGTTGTVARLGGKDRVDTALAVSRWLYPPGAEETWPEEPAAAVLARADAFPDALTGTSLAAASQGPLLLSHGHRLDPRVGAELQRVLRVGPGLHPRVYVLGGAAVMSPQLVGDVEALGYHVVRLSGPDRYATAAAVAEEIHRDVDPAWGCGYVLADGRGFADPVAASQLRHQALLFTSGSVLPAATLGELNRCSSTTAYGPYANVIGQAAYRALVTAGDALDRVRLGPAGVLYGADRYATSVQVATFGSASTGGDVVVLATGTDFPDALVAGRLRPHPLLLTRPGALPPVVAEMLRANAATLDRAIVVGGTGAVSDEVLLEVQRLIAG